MSQNIERIEFKHSNSMITGRQIDITFESIRNNKKGKIKGKINKDGEKYSTRISKEKFMIISDAIRKMNPSDLYIMNGKDTISTFGNYLDPTSSSITIYDDKQNKKSFYAENLRKKSQFNDKQKDFWDATRLIINAARLKMEDLIDYK
ncbi:MAG: hypothetical protein E2590_18990 [Chryseobacterium sp.]|nr:hypothetical protein [Chryseobacterium sp.]